MKLNLFSISQKLSVVGYILLFPVFFIYHFCLSQNYFPAILGGLFGIVSLFVALISYVLLPWILKYKIRYVNVPVFIFYLSILFYLSWTFGNQFLIQNHPYGNHSFLESYSSFIIWGALFYIGFFLPLESVNFYKFLKYTSLIIFLIFGFSILKENTFFALFKIFQNNDESSALSSYQQAGRSIFISFIFLSLFGQNKLLNLIILLTGAVILLSIGSRTDLISIFIIIILYCFHMLIKGNGTLNKKILVFSTFLFLLFCTYFLTRTAFNDSRAAELFDLASSTSWQGRSDLSSNALNIIKQYPIFGKFDYYDTTGGYAHNILSSWTSFGFFGFILYLFILIFFLLKSFYGYLFNNNLSNMWLLVFGLNLISFIQALVAAPIFSALPALGWGLTLNVYIKSKYNEI